MNGTLLPLSLPPSWLKQIRKAVLPGTIMTLLGSSVIAALIGSVASYLLETRKANVELEKTQAIEKRQSLQTLSNHLVALDRELDTLVATSQLLPRYGSDSKLSGYARKSIGYASEQMVLVFADLKDRRLDTDIKTQVTEILDALGPRLQELQKDPRNIGELAELIQNNLRAD